ncbi:MAG: HDOD domain-containing protein [Betaproteobacteria bacterium]|nr:HDOD domain-containing protein [Betaproteobacteria bacterium]
MAHTPDMTTFEGIKEQAQGLIHLDVALVARQPIFDVSNNVPAYELLFRDPAMKPGLGGKNPSAATATVLIDGFELIRPTLRHGQRLFINFTEETLEAGLATMLPPDICVVEVLEHARPTPTLLQELRNLRQQGYTLALDDYTGQEELAAFLPLIDLVKVDVYRKGEAEIRSMVKILREYEVTLLAEKVEDSDTMRLCRELNFALFQGFFFGHVEIVKGKKLSPSQAVKFRLLSLTSSEESKINSVAEVVMADISLSYKLLRHINSVYFGLSKKVNSIRQAILLLGRQKFHQWLCVTILAGLDAAPMSHELAYASALRGKFLEVLARRNGEILARHSRTVTSSQRGMGASLFLLGLFSLLEHILGIPINEVRNELPMEEAMMDALATGTGPYAPWLDLIKAYELGEWDRVDTLVSHLGQSSAVLKASYAEAALWASDIFNDSQRQPKVRGIDFSLKKILPEHDNSNSE